MPLTLALLLGCAGSARAIGLDCTSAPDSPTEGIGGSIDPGVAHPRPGDPFAKDPKTTLYETYGWDGAGWVNYDLGCGPDATRDTTAVMFGNSANAGFGMLDAAAASTVALFRAAVRPGDYTPALDSNVGVHITRGTENVFVKVFALGLLVLALLMMLRAHRGQFARAATQTGTAVLLTFGAAAAIAWSATGGPLIDRVLTTSVNGAAEAATEITQGATAGLSAPDALGANLQEATVWQTWKAGAVGRDAGPAADAASECLFASSNLTKAERAHLDKEPKDWDDVWSAKQGRFDTCAEQLKDADPLAYRHLAGHENLDRNWTVGIGWLAWASVAPLTLIASLMLLLCTLIARITLWMFPILAAIALIPAARPTLRRVADLITSAFLNGLLFAFVAIIWTSGAVGVVANLSGGTAVLVLVLLLVLEFTFLFFLHPFRRLRQSVSVLGANAPSLARYHDRPPPEEPAYDAGASLDDRVLSQFPGSDSDPDVVADTAAHLASQVSRAPRDPAAVQAALQAAGALSGAPADGTSADGVPGDGSSSDDASLNGTASSPALAGQAPRRELEGGGAGAAGVAAAVAAAEVRGLFWPKESTPAEIGTGGREGEDGDLAALPGSPGQPWAAPGGADAHRSERNGFDDDAFDGRASDREATGREWADGGEGLDGGHIPRPRPALPGPDVPVGTRSGDGGPTVAGAGNAIRVAASGHGTDYDVLEGYYVPGGTGRGGGTGQGNGRGGGRGKERDDDPLTVDWLSWKDDAW